jgi:hypothetical protein
VEHFEDRVVARLGARCEGLVEALAAAAGAFTSALDPELVGEVLNVIRRRGAAHDLTMLMVTHQMGFAREFSDRVCFFYAGKIPEAGPPDRLFTSPRNERTQQFLSAVLEAGRAEVRAGTGGLSTGSPIRRSGARVATSEGPAEADALATPRGGGYDFRGAAGQLRAAACQRRARSAAEERPRC